MADKEAERWKRAPTRKIRVASALAVLALLSLVAKAAHDTLAEPQFRRLTVSLPQLPTGSKPLRLVLMSDIHIAGPDMPPSRLAAIVRQVNAVEPDLVLIAGDFVSDKGTATKHYTIAESIAPLGALRPNLATIAVPGNHDHWRDLQDVRAELTRHGVVMLANEASRVGPLVIGGLDDDFTGHADLAATLRAVALLGGAPVLLSHSPDPFPDVPHGAILMLAGHTHCGQLRYPWGGSPATMSRYGDSYACGVVRENGKVLVTTGGLGTSVLPFRFGTLPEMWIIELRPR